MNWTIFAIFATMFICFIIRMPIAFSIVRPAENAGLGRMGQ